MLCYIFFYSCFIHFLTASVQLRMSTVYKRIWIWMNAKINKVKDLALIFWSVSSAHQNFICYQKHIEQAFYNIIFHLHPFNVKCLSSTVNLIAVMSLLLTSCLHCCNQRIFSKNTSYAVRNSILLAIFFWIFYSNWSFFLRVVQ